MTETAPAAWKRAAIASYHRHIARNNGDPVKARRLGFVKASAIRTALLQAPDCFRLHIKGDLVEVQCTAGGILHLPLRLAYDAQVLPRVALSA